LGTHDNHKVTLNEMRAWNALGDDFRSSNNASKLSVILTCQHYGETCWW